MRKVDMDAADEIYKIAKSDAEIEIALLKDEIEAVREESEALGKVKALDCSNSFNTLHRYAVIYQIKQKKEYKGGGMTWVEFCEAIGEPQRTVDRILSEIKPLAEDFSAKLADSIGLPFNKIRYLGMSVSGNLAEIEDGCLLFDGQKIPFTPENKDEIEAAIDAMKETHVNEVKALRADVKKYKNGTDKIVKEETKALTKERAALIEKIERLEVFAPDDKDPDTWMIEQMDLVQQAALEFSAICRRVVMDERIVGDNVTLGKVEGMMQSVELTCKMLRDKWNEIVDMDEE